jgi:hypothetical protein
MGQWCNIQFLPFYYLCTVKLSVCYSVPAVSCRSLQILLVTQYFISYDLQKCILLRTYELGAFCIEELEVGYSVN